ncbi:MAG: hypothetical protein U0528_11415 [Anaerolineae bacterium]|nr:hypothetical protein [Anaerolineae bacterium]
MFSQSDLDRNKPCPICGQSNYEWGFAYQMGYRRGETFKVFATRSGYTVLRVRRCVTCDNVQSFIDDTATKRMNSRIVITVVVVMLIVFFVAFLPLFLGLG